MIENKQLLDATQLVVWHHVYQRMDSRAINRDPAVRLCPFLTGQILDKEKEVLESEHCFSPLSAFVLFVHVRKKIYEK